MTSEAQCNYERAGKLPEVSGFEEAAQTREMLLDSYEIPPIVTRFHMSHMRESEARVAAIALGKVEQLVCKCGCARMVA
jgi:hypothetical protein